MNRPDKKEQTKNIIFISVAFVSLIVATLSIFVFQQYSFNFSKDFAVIFGKIDVSSNAFLNGEKIPAKYTCDAENINPPITISDLPDKTESVVLIMEDLDSPDEIWTHWILWNINPKTSEVLEGTLPIGAIEGVNDFGNIGYGGPCPPSGEHRYIFNVYALDSSLNLEKGSSKEELNKSMQTHILVSSKLEGLYSK